MLVCVCVWIIIEREGEERKSGSDISTHSQAVAKNMVARGNGGAIVNISSQGSKVALQDHTLYCKYGGRDK